MINGIPKSTLKTFMSALRALSTANIPFLVGGAFAIQCYTGYLRNTKDLDLFLYKRDVDEAMARLKDAGFTTKIEYDHWLAKAYKNSDYVDLIYGSGNWLIEVDESFFRRSVSGEVLGIPVQLLAPEEIIWSKAYVEARERFDGSDIIHLISATRGNLDWDHLIKRFGEHWQLLFANILLFDFVFPSERNHVPEDLVENLVHRMRQIVKGSAPKEKVCRGTLLDRYSFIYDVELEGYKDPREWLAEKRGYGVEQVIEDRTHAKAANLQIIKP